MISCFCLNESCEKCDRDRRRPLFFQPLSSALDARAAALGRRARERVVAGGDVGVVAEHDGAGEHVQRVPVDPLVVVALVELVALRRVAEEAGTVADLGADRVVEGAEPAGAELVPVVADEVASSSRSGGAGVELAQDGGLLLVGSREGGDATGRNALGLAAAGKTAMLLTSAGTLGWDGREPRARSVCRRAEARPASS